MKDLIIPGRYIVRELRIFSACFAAALCVNVYSIVRFKTAWIELITTLHITLALAAMFFVVAAAVRGMTFLGRRILRRGTV